MKSSLFFAAVLLVAASILMSVVNDAQKERVVVVKQEQLALQFLNYVEALNDLFAAGTPADGDVTALVTLPDWQPKTSRIVLRISSGVGYAFLPSSPGLFSQLLQYTENSGHFGLSDVAGINTPAGQLNRPSFIPVGYVVYVR